MQREPIYAALFALVSSVAGVKCASRRLKSFADIGQGDQPALFQEQKTEQSQATTNLPSKWTLSVDLLLFVSTGANDPGVIPSSVLNPLLDAVTAKLVPPPQLGEQTLGGLVTRCRVEGQIQIVEGIQGDQAWALIPVQVFVSD